MKRPALQTSMVVVAVALGTSCSTNDSNATNDATHGSGVLGSGGAAPAGSAGTTTPANSGTGGTPKTSGGSQAGSGGATMPPASGGPATGGSVATPPVDAGAGGSVADAGMSAPAGAKLLPTDNVDAMGPYEVTIEMNVGPNMGWIAHPTELGANGELHPIFSWGCGGGSDPSQYMDHLTRWASHGFVVEAHVSNGDGAEHKMILDWLAAQNDAADSPYYHKLAVDKIAVGGHSIGSIATFAFEGMDDRPTTSIHVAGGSFDGNGYMSLKKPTLMVDADGDTLALANTQADYAAATVPVFLTVITGSDHIYAARDGLAPIVAWLRWWLAGESERKSMFIGPDCDFCKGKFVSMSKNW